MSQLVLTGSSTGGPGLIETIVKHLPARIDGSLIIAQHMDPLPLKSFARRLARLCGHEVVYVQDDTPVRENAIYLLGDTAVLERTAVGMALKKPNGSEGFYHPTIDFLFESAARLRSYRISAFLLSGIGSDGAKGLKALKDAGQMTFAQDEATSIVYGMPKAAVEMDAAKRIMPIDTIAHHVRSLLSC